MSGTFNTKDLASVLELLSKHEISEFKWERGEEKIFLRRGKEPTVIRRVVPRMHQIVTSNPLPQSAGAQSAGSNVIPLVNVQDQRNETSHSGPGSARDANALSQQSQPVEEPVRRKALKEITSPMVGTFYRRPAVDAEPYVGVGDPVKKGDVLCIVEAMKLMNEIESDIAGRIAEVCLEDGQMVEYGEVLFRIEVV